MIYLLVCIICTACLGLLFKWSEKWNTNISNIIIINYLACVILGLIYLGRIFISHMGQTWSFYAYLMGALFIIGFNLFAKTIQQAGLSLSALFQKMSIVITVLVAWLLGESVNGLQWMGIATAILGLYLVFYKDKRFEINLRSEVFGLLISSLAVSSAIEIGFMLTKKIEHSSAYFNLLFPCYVFLSAAILGSVNKVMRQKSFSFSKNDIIFGIAIGIPNFFSIYTMILSLQSGMNASVFFPVLNCSIILMSSLFSKLLFKEYFSTQKWLGLLLCLAAIFLIQFFAS